VVPSIAVIEQDGSVLVLFPVRAAWLLNLVFLTVSEGDGETISNCEAPCYIVLLFSLLLAVKMKSVWN
jgi:hypothetical protein